MQAVREKADAVTGGAEKLHAAVDAIFAYFDEHEKSFRVWVTATHGLDWNDLPQFGERVFAQMRTFPEDTTSLCRRAGAGARREAGRRSA